MNSFVSMVLPNTANGIWESTTKSDSRYISLMRCVSYALRLPKPAVTRPKASGSCEQHQPLVLA